jgi:hypothetical protein
MERIAALYVIESEVHGKPPDPRRELRQSPWRPLIEGVPWLEKALATLSRKKTPASQDPTTAANALQRPTP